MPPKCGKKIQIPISSTSRYKSQTPASSFPFTPEISVPHTPESPLSAKESDQISPKPVVLSLVKWCQHQAGKSIKNKLDAEIWDIPLNKTLDLKNKLKKKLQCFFMLRDSHPLSQLQCYANYI
jgi:hypothetical protein